MRRALAHLAVIAAVAVAPTALVSAQPALDPPIPIAGDVPLPDYLGLLAQIAPAAHGGAQAYLRAFEERCGRPMQTAELRRAMSEGDGDPILMGMIRASHLRDANGINRLGERIDCKRGPR